MLRGSNLSEDVGVRLDDRDLVYLEPALAATFERSSAVRGDLVFTSWGSVGQLGLIDEGSSYERYIVSNKQMKLSPDLEQIVPAFLYYYLSQPRMVQEVKSRAIGSTIPGFNLGQLRALPIEIPALKQQRAIAEVLGALDEKIAANANLVESVDSLAQAKFFAALRHAALQPLSSCAEFVNGKAFTKGASGTGRVVARIAELNSGISSSTVFSDAEVDDKHVARPGDILFAWSGSLTLHRWYRDDAIVNQHIFKVIPKAGNADWLVYQLLRHKLTEFKMIAADKATTMGHIQRRHLDEPVLVPAREEVEKVATVMQALWDTALTAEREKLALISLRDALLPQLMSGKLQVKDAADLVEAAV